MEKFNKFIKDELSGWKKWEVFWFLFANAVILGISIYLKDTTIGIISSITGTMCVILSGKGKMSNYLFGTVNIILYAYIAYKAKYYGDVMLNVLYYFPTNIIGWFVWKKHINEKNQEVIKRRLTLKQDGILLLICVAGIGVYGFVLRMLGGNLPFVDSMSTVLSIVAQVLLIKRYMEQCVVWIFVDIVSVIMWVVAMYGSGASVATLIMWSVYLLNAFIMFVKWFKESKGRE